MATVGCPPGYSCPPPTQVGLNQLEPSGGGWEYLYTAFANEGNPDGEAIGEFMDFEFTVGSAQGILASFQQALSTDFWSTWRQEFVNAGSDMYIAKIFVLPPASFPGTATYRVVVVHSQAVGTFLDLIGDLLGLLVKSPWLLLFLGIIFFGQTILAFLKNFCANVAGDYCHPIQTAEGAYVWIAVVGALVVIGGYVVSNEISKHEGLGPVKPPAPAGFSSPGFNTETGLRLGPVHQTAGTSTGRSRRKPQSNPWVRQRRRGR